MNAGGDVLETVRWSDGRVRILDQTLLPGSEVYLELETLDEVTDAIRRLAVRGAPAIGVAGAARDPDLDVYLNSTSLSSFSLGNDATIYRSAVNGGRYRKKTVTFPASLLSVGINAIDLRLVGVSEKGGIMYDVITLEVY